MIGYVVRRMLWAVPVCFVISVITFGLMHSIPGNPFDKMDKPLPAQVLKQLMAHYQLDKPVYMQYLQYIGNALQGNLGPSYQYMNRTVNEIIAGSFPKSIVLGIMGVAVALIIGVPLGIVAAVRHNTAMDYLSMFIALIGVSVPAMTMAWILIWVFALKLGILPVARWGSVQQAILPVFTLGVGGAAILARLTRASLLQVLREDYIRAARAKGVTEWIVIVRHALRNALIPVVTVLGPLTAGMLTGSLVVERIFAIPGLGKYFVESVNVRDYPVIMGTTLLYALVLVAANLVVDITYYWIDPRIKMSKN